MVNQPVESWIQLHEQEQLPYWPYKDMRGFMDHSEVSRPMSGLFRHTLSPETSLKLVQTKVCVKHIFFRHSLGRTIPRLLVLCPTTVRYISDINLYRL